jgi:hypothetical protein
MTAMEAQSMTQQQLPTRRYINSIEPSQDPTYKVEYSTK